MKKQTISTFYNINDMKIVVKEYPDFVMEIYDKNNNILGSFDDPKQAKDIADSILEVINDKKIC
jgi:hypothetical protein